MTSTELFQVEREGQALIVTPRGDLHELDFQEIETEGREVLQRFDEEPVRNIVLDLSRTKTCGSTALGLFVTLAKRAEQRGGRMAVCGLSAFEREAFEVMHIGANWPARETREEALRAVEGG